MAIRASHERYTGSAPDMAINSAGDLKCPRCKRVIVENFLEMHHDAYWTAEQLAERYLKGGCECGYGATERTQSAQGTHYVSWASVVKNLSSLMHGSGKTVLRR